MSPYSRTYESHPELWDTNPSFMVKLLYKDKSQAVLASGWHLRSIEFENPTVNFEKIDETNSAIIISNYGQFDTESFNFWDNITRYEFEISLDEIHNDAIRDTLSKVLLPDVADEIFKSMKNMIQRISANKANTTLLYGDNQKIDTVDLICQNLPARSGNTQEPLRSLFRWCRIFHTERGTITIYQSIPDSEKTNLRWPHNGIWLNRGSKYFTEESEIGSIKQAFSIPIQYEDYNLENWRIEFEFWENLPFQIMATNNSEEATKRLLKAQKEIGILSDFVTTAFMATRNLEHRARTNSLIVDDQDILQIAKEHIKNLKEKIELYRSKLEVASTLLANTAQSVQATTSQESAQIAERTNAFLTYASAIFFLPTLIISFFSMSIIGLEKPESAPSLIFVLTLCLTSVTIALVTLFIYRYAAKKSLQKRKSNVQNY